MMWRIPLLMLPFGLLVVGFAASLSLTSDTLGAAQVAIPRCATGALQLHFTPTSSSWMNQVETWFSIISRKAIRRGVFKSLGALIDAIQRFLDAWNENSKPFVWVKSAEQLLSRMHRQPFKMTVH
jgi:hypothetical protein